MKNVLGILFLTNILLGAGALAAERPNILLCISDDQSYAHAGANGDRLVKTPAFDRVAEEGVLMILRVNFHCILTQKSMTITP